MVHTFIGVAQGIDAQALGLIREQPPRERYDMLLHGRAEVTHVLAGVVDAVHAQVAAPHEARKPKTLGHAAAQRDEFVMDAVQATGFDGEKSLYSDGRPINLVFEGGKIGPAMFTE